MKKIPIPDNFHLVIARYHEEGSTIASVAIEFGYDHHMVKKWLIRSGVSLKSKEELSKTGAFKSKKPQNIPLPEENEFRSVCAQLIFNEKIAEHYEVSVPTIKRWKRKFKIDCDKKKMYQVVGESNRLTPPDNLQEMIDYYSEFGVSLYDVEERFDCPYHRVVTFFKRAGVKIKTHAEIMDEWATGQRKHRPNKAEFQQLIYDGMTFTELSEYYDLHETTLCAYARDNDIDTGSPGERISNGRQKGFDSRLPDIPDLDRQYADCGYNQSFLMRKHNLTIYQLRRLFELKGIEVVLPQRSLAEIFLFNNIVQFDLDNEWVHSNRDILKNRFELDMYSSTRKLAIEYCGVFFHSERRHEDATRGKHPNYHRDKMRECQDQGIKLITIFDTDDEKKVWNFIKSKIGRAKSIGARECEVRSVESKEARAFENEWHLSSSRPAKINYGLFYQGELVSTMSFGMPRYNKKFQYEVVRYTCHTGYIVSGGANRLWKAFIEEYDPESVISYADLRFGDGSYCGRLGFERQKDTSPGYWYHWKYTGPLHHRSGFQKKMLKEKLEIYDENLTEIENMRLNGWDRIFDCGNAVWTWNTDKEKPGINPG